MQLDFAAIISELIEDGCTVLSFDEAATYEYITAPNLRKMISESSSSRVLLFAAADTRGFRRAVIIRTYPGANNWYFLIYDSGLTKPPATAALNRVRLTYSDPKRKWDMNASNSNITSMLCDNPAIAKQRLTDLLGGGRLKCSNIAFKEVATFSSKCAGQD